MEKGLTMKMNYYEMLGLSVEAFEDDPTKLEVIAKEKITEWSTHRRISEQQKAQIHGNYILEAIQNPSEWKCIYNECKKKNDEHILFQIIICTDDSNKIAMDNVDKISARFNVSTEYVMDLCYTNKIQICDIRFTIDDLKPSSSLRLKCMQSVIESLGASDLMELLANSEYAGITLNDHSSNDEVIEALKIVKKKWARVCSTGAKATQKSQVDKIYAGFFEFLKNGSFDEYIKYLRYLGAERILSEIKASKVTSLGENAVNSIVNELNRFTHNTDKAKGILTSFCAENGITCP